MHKDNINSFKYILLDEGKKRIFGLDFLRALAILLVLISHGRHYLGNAFGFNTEYLSFGGYLGVELFFVLSGFLIGGILLKIFNKKDKDISLKDIKNFWIRRWFRTLPNYYFVLFLNFIIISLYLGYLNFDFRYLVFLQNLFTPAIGNMNYAQSWSLTVEEWFYFITPIVLFLSVKIFKFKVNKSIFIAILVMVVFIPFVKMFYIIFVDMCLRKSEKIDFNTLRIIAILRLDSILYGVLMSYFYYYYKNTIRRIKNCLLIPGAISFCFIIVILLMQVNGFRPTNIFSILFTSLGSIGLSLMLPFFNDIRVNRSNWFHNFITLTSVISYSLYLVHFSFVGFFLKIFKLANSISFFLFWLLSYIISIILYYFFESRMTKLRDYYNNKNSVNTILMK
jgi:peptidoglycan/LPS O-acetylase OafA/YrhL